ncbi:porin [Neorhizobium sp. T786]|uniref:porin n=1 Tax=Pseudorhizobium xiangyangii TaxID=2883104 RepID=UPI001CFF5B12|nr:porin [Neorhizobium xiangyangii]MCB5203408.1 porin [Neorhizobium xiangyangii]
MNIKSLLLGSAAALAAVSGAQAADAIIAAEPEPMEYVRVCDAFGTGYFYIPGTETCLKVGGYVRFQVNATNLDGARDWNAFTRGRLEVVSKSDTELGELTGFIAIHGQSDNQFTGEDNFYMDEVYLQLGGFKAGNYLNWWDKGINGETDQIGGSRQNSIAYIYTGDAFTAGIQLDEIQESVVPGSDNDLGLEAIVTASFGAASIDLLGSYDFDAEEGAIRALVSAEVGPGTLQAAGIWASDVNYYYSGAEWTIAASYAFKATEKFTITPGVQYFDNFLFSGDDAWRAGLTVDYAVTEGMAVKVTANYNDRDGADEFWDGFVRLQRSF